MKEEKKQEIKNKMVGLFIVNGWNEQSAEEAFDLVSNFLEFKLKEQLESVEMEIGEKINVYWRHPMALYPKDHTPQSELKPMVEKETVLQIINNHK